MEILQTSSHISSTSDPFMDAGKASGVPSNDYTDLFENTARNDTLDIPLLRDSVYDRMEEQHLRVWVAPDLSNPEYLSLLSLFPSSISRREVPLFESQGHKGKKRDIESGMDNEGEKSEIQCGSGKMWIGNTERSLLVMKGGVWDRFVSWCRSLLCF